MINLSHKIIEEEIRKNKYNKEEIDFAIDYINNFLVKLNKLLIKENDIERNLNELEKFICIYDFVTKRNYNNIREYSQDIIGAINHNCFVCASFSKLIKILCDECNIYCFIKHCFSEKTGFHANNEVLIKDESGNYHLLHIDATIDCLNYENLYCDKHDYIPRINGFLLVEEDINKYRNTLQYIEPTNQIYTNLVMNKKPNEIFELTEHDKNCIEYFDYIYEEIIWYKIENYNKLLIELSKYLNINYSENININDFKTSVQHICKYYNNILEIYNKLVNPIEFNELIDAMENVQLSLLEYEYPNRIDNKNKAKENVLKQLQLSLEFQLKTYNNNNGKSFMFTLVNKFLNNK